MPALLHREPLPQNNQPLNQIARRYLKLAQQPPDPTQLYLLQLLQWGLDSGKVTLQTPDWKDQLRESLDNLQGSDPEQAMQYLVNNPDDPQSPLLLPRQLRKAMSPREAAQVVMNSLDLRLTADPEVDYPPTRYRRRS